MRGLDSLKVAEGRVAFDVVLLLEAVELCRVNVHPRQHLRQIKPRIKSNVGSTGGDEKLEMEEVKQTSNTV